MIRLIEAKNYRSLKYISQPLEDFHVLVGANATGKTTFLDVVSFIADLVGNGVDYAINQRTQNYMDLTFGGKGGDIELAVELEISEEQQNLLRKDNLDRIRYELRVGLNEGGEHCIKEERVLLLDFLLKSELKVKDITQSLSNIEEAENSLFYKPDKIKPIIVKTAPNKRISKEGIRFKEIITSKGRGEYHFYPESGFVLNLGFKLGVKKSALGNLPADDKQFPVSTWLKDLFLNGVQTFFLDSQDIRKASPPGKGIKFKTDGSNLPWVIEDLKKKDLNAYENWVQHIRTALPDVKEIITVERQDDRHRYLKVRYDNGIEVPSWMVSDGTLRLLALTLPAYLPDFEGVYLIEEPENGIHPRAIETVFQSLSSVYNAQMLLATHSPVILSMVELKDVLCFAKTSDGVTEIVRGDEHPMLKDWRGETNLSVLFAAGVLS